MDAIEYFKGMRKRIDYRATHREMSFYDAAIKALEQTVLLEQVRWERDIAIKQLADLGYEFGEKIEQQPCYDAISRQAAIEIIQNWLNFDTGYSCGEKNVMKCAINELMDLPSVSTEKTGQWIKKKSMIYCSECCDGFDVFTLNDPFKYCPNCGSRMEVEE